MNTNTDLIRSHVDTIIMRTLENQDRYGYAILDIIATLSDDKYVIKQPTLYSCLKRLEKQGFISSYAGVETNGAQRKYYKLEEKGFDTLNQDKIEWEFSRSIIDKLLSDKKVELKDFTPPFDASNLRPLTKRIKAYDVLENGEVEYDGNDDIEDFVNKSADFSDLERDTVSVTLFDECKAQLKVANDKIYNLENEKMVLQNVQPIANVSTSEDTLTSIREELNQANTRIQNLQSMLSEATITKVNNTDTDDGDNFDSNALALFSQLEEANDQISIMQERIDELENSNFALHKTLLNKIAEMKNYSYSAQENNLDMALKQDTTYPKTVTLDTINKSMATSIPPINIVEIAEQAEANEQKNSAKKLLSIGEYSRVFTPIMDDTSNKINYEETVASSSAIQRDATISERHYATEATNHPQQEYIKAEPIKNNFANNTEKLSSSPIVNLKNEMIKNGYKVKTYAKESTSEYYHKNYVYSNKMLNFVSIGLFLVNIIEILIFGLVDKFFKLNTIGYIILGILVTLPPIYSLTATISNGTKISKKSSSILKKFATKFLTYILSVLVVLLAFVVIPSLKPYLWSGLMFIPIILLFNIPLSELFIIVAEKSNKYNVNY